MHSHIIKRIVRIDLEAREPKNRPASTAEMLLGGDRTPNTPQMGHISLVVRGESRADLLNAPDRPALVEWSFLSNEGGRRATL
jgi:hypothetical protein